MLTSKLLIFGIDSAEYTLLKSWSSELPNLQFLLDKLGKYFTTIPPITIPAWLTIFSGFNPGWFGLYDVKYRVPGTYTEFRLFNRELIKNFKFIWDYVCSRNGKVILCYVPGTYPPPEIKGIVISDFFTPSINDPKFIYPQELRNEVFNVLNGEEYIIDVPGYKKLEPVKLYNLLLKKIDQDMKIFIHLVKNYDWNLAICVLMSIDRAQHVLWKYFDKTHPKYEYNPELENLLLNLLKRIDYWFDKLLQVIPRNTKIVLISDHGAKPMYMRININEVLIQERFLKLREKPKKPMTLQEADKLNLIDWENTIAWSWGAYVGQIWINLKDREPRGCVKTEHYEETCKQIGDLMLKITDPDGKKLNTKVFCKWEIYKGLKVKYMPDITIYFDNLHFGVNTMIGLNDTYSFETEIGVDYSNHGEYGIFSCSENIEYPDNVFKISTILKQLIEQ